MADCIGAREGRPHWRVVSPTAFMMLFAHATTSLTVWPRVIIELGSRGLARRVIRELRLQWLTPEKLLTRHADAEPIG